MCIDNYAWNIKYIPSYYIGSLSPYSGKHYKLLKLLWHNPSVFTKKHPCTGYDVLCLIMIKSRRMNIIFHPFKVCSRKIFQSLVFLKQIPCNHIYSVICTLCTKDGCKEQLPGILVQKIGTALAPVVLNKPSYYLVYPLSFLL